MHNESIAREILLHSNLRHVLCFVEGIVRYVDSLLFVSVFRHFASSVNIWLLLLPEVNTLGVGLAAPKATRFSEKIDRDG